MKHLKEIIRVRNIALLIVTSFLVLDLFVNKVTNMLQGSLTPQNICHLILFFVTLVLVFLWYDATRTDLKYANQWLAPKKLIQPGTTLESIAVLANAITLIALLMLSGNPFFYGMLLVPYSIITSLMDRYARNIYKVAIESTQDEYALIESQTLEIELRKSALQILRDYYVSKPFGVLAIYSNSLKIAGLIFAFVWRSNPSLFAYMLVYSLYILAIVAAEIILWSWRAKRNRRLADILQICKDRGIDVESKEEEKIY